jgi:hypothetical protein
LFDAEKYSASAAQHAASANSGSPLGRTSELTFSDLSPLIYHETECNLSSQVQKKPHFDSNRQQICNAHAHTSQIHILLPFIPPSQAMKLHVLFNV